MHCDVTIAWFNRGLSKKSRNILLRERERERGIDRHTHTHTHTHTIYVCKKEFWCHALKVFIQVFKGDVSEWELWSMWRAWVLIVLNVYSSSTQNFLCLSTVEIALIKRCDYDFTKLRHWYSHLIEMVNYCRNVSSDLRSIHLPVNWWYHSTSPLHPFYT